MWPQYILDQFALIPANTTLENRYNGVYNSILSRECFNTAQFSVEPHYVLPGAEDPYEHPVQSFVTFVVTVDDKAVFFLQILPPYHVDKISTRVSADNQMRHRFEELYDICPTPRVHGVSVMGQRLSFYWMDKLDMGFITPAYVLPSPVRITDTVPQTNWDLDITTEEGFVKFMAVVQDVREMSQAL